MAQWTPLKRFFRLLSEFRQELRDLYLFAIFLGIVNLSLPLGIQAIINFILGAQVSTSWVVLVIAVTAGAGFAGYLQIQQMAITELVQQKLFARSAFEFAYRIPRIKALEVRGNYVPELVNRFFDTLTIQKGISKILLDFSSAGLQIVFGLLLLSFYHPFFVFFGLILIVILGLIFRLTGPRGLKSSLSESKHKYEVVHWLEEVARTLHTFKLAGNSTLPEQKIDRLVHRYINARKEHFKVLVLQYSCMVGFKLIVIAGLLWLGGLLVLENELNIGQFIAAEIIIILVINAVEKLVLSLETVYDVLTGLDKLGGVLDLPMDGDGGSTSLGDGSPGLEIDIKGLRFAYPDSDNDVICGIDLKVSSGERICISGASGSGKSTLIHLISGLFDRFEGRLCYNGIPMSQLRLSELREHIGDSLSDQHIFEGTLMENICLGRPGFSEQDVMRALGTVGLDEFLRSQPRGLNTVINPIGEGLSSRIIKRLLLARAILTKPRLLLLENALERVDGEDKNRLISYLTSEERPWTLITVSNNAQFASKCDRVIVLEKGSILAEGRFEDLVIEPWAHKVFDLQ